ncbi:TPR-like protein [Trichodelitschia bisporula]|uniref:TPR-like protein n=1 Tax=Trichodelitschia bisporula TaxID=703511 RepID=A0A6G1I8F6_9PEZI|nr:TPR-like protein [Trichodelitschia bisporula]
MIVSANDAYEKALGLDPANAQAKSGLESVKRAMESEAGGADPSGGLGNIFNDPQLIQKLAKNPKTSYLLADNEFMAKLQRIRQNPNAAGAELSDPRFLQVISVLLGIDMQFRDPNAGPGGPGGSAQEVQEDVPMPDAPSSKPEPKREPTPESEDEEAATKREAKAKADEEKKLGTENYKKRQFDAAIEHYTKAWSLFKDVTYLTNLSAAYYEKGDYEKCIETCKQAVDEGREVMADFKLIAKAFGRIGSAYEKLGDYSQAIFYFNKSLTEHRTPDVLSKLRAAEKAKIVAERDARQIGLRRLRHTRR